MGGWLHEDSSTPWNGPSAEARIILSRMRGFVRPWVQLGTKHSVGYLRTNITTETEVVIEDELETEWSLTGVLGISFAIKKEIEVGLGIDFPWVRYPAISIPGFHVFAVYRGEKQ